MWEITELFIRDRRLKNIRLNSDQCFIENSGYLNYTTTNYN